MSWSRQRVAIVATTIFVAHVVGIFAMRTPAPMVVLPDGFRGATSGGVSRGAADGIELDGLSDPLVFAGAHQHGFSAAAWMMRPRPAFAMSNSLPPPRYLAFSRSAAEYSALDPAATGAGRVELPKLDFNLPKEAQASKLTIEGGLSGRGLVRPLQIPLQSGSDVLSNTVVQVAVRADGFPFSARIISGSGSRLADLAALDLANKARFAPAPPRDHHGAGELAWGNLVFRWFTMDAAATNLPAKTAVSTAR